MKVSLLFEDRLAGVSQKEPLIGTLQGIAGHGADNDEDLLCLFRVLDELLEGPRSNQRLYSLRVISVVVHVDSFLAK